MLADTPSIGVPIQFGSLPVFDAVQNDAAVASEIVADDRDRRAGRIAADEERIAAKPAVDFGNDLIAGRQHEEAIVALGTVGNQLLDVDVADIQAAAEHAVVGDDEVVRELGTDNAHGVEAVAAIDADRSVQHIENGVGAAVIRQNPRLGQEVFGPSAILVRVNDAESLLGLVDTLEGQLSATIHMRETDFALAARLLPALEHKAGRIIANGWPTGVEVAHAMVHGGPFPATSDSRMTSVGSLAIERFLRPICYQDVPGALLPSALRDGDGRFERLVDGVRVGPDAARGS